MKERSLRTCITYLYRQGSQPPVLLAVGVYRLETLERLAVFDENGRPLANNQIILVISGNCSDYISALNACLFENSRAAAVATNHQGI